MSRPLARAAKEDSKLATPGKPKKTREIPRDDLAWRARKETNGENHTYPANDPETFLRETGEK